MTAAVQASADLPWQIRCSCPGRLRLRVEALEHSDVLRRHCRTVLTACHWLEGFRINPLAGSLALRFSPQQAHAVPALLSLALTLPVGLAGLAALETGDPSHRRSFNHASLCGAILLLDWLVGVPLVALQGITVLLMLPLLPQLFRQLQRQRRLPVEALDLGFSAMLLQLGLPREALMDLALDDASELLQVLNHSHPTHTDEHDLLLRIAEQFRVRRTAPEPGSVSVAEAAAGDRLHLRAGDPLVLNCTLERGSLLVINRQLTGDWHPRQLLPGAELRPGTLVIAGEGEVSVRFPFTEDPLFQLPGPPVRPEQTGWRACWSAVRPIRPLINPTLFGLGVFWALRGSAERALAAFQFNPINDWETSQGANHLAAVSELRLHGINLVNPEVFQTLARVETLLISSSCAERLCPLELQEVLAPDSPLQEGELLRVLAGVQQWLVRDQTIPIWNAQLENIEDPIAVLAIDLHDLDVQGWQLELGDGRRLTLLRRSREAAGPADPEEVDALELLQEGEPLGWLRLRRSPNPLWQSVCADLRQLGVAVEIGCSTLHDGDDASIRLKRVEDLQAGARIVAYMGDVLEDIPALARADVAIGLDFDEAGLFTSRLCDVSLGRDLQWLPRLLLLSRRLTRTARTNAVLIGLTHVLSSVATAGLVINPLQTVLIADLPLLLAELLNIGGFSTHGPRPAQARVTSQLLPR